MGWTKKILFQKLIIIIIINKVSKPENLKSYGGI